jgi:dienelactone hydrolase
VNATSIGAWQLRGTPWRPFEASVCYPCADAGCDAVAANPADAAGRWPAVVFGIGWNSWAQRYHNTLQHLASHGFVVLAPTTVDRRFVPRAWEYAQTLVGALQFAAAESARPGSLLASRVDVSRAGAFGHSMGAGSAAIAASLSGDSSWAASLGIEPRAGWPWGSASLLDFDASRAQWPNITALCTLGVAPVTAPLAGLAALRARTLFMVPARDRFVAPEAQRALFDALPTLPGAAPRALALLQGGSHCWLDEPAVRGEWGLPSSQCELAAADAQAYMTPDAQARATSERATLLLCFLASR